jgi:hypothetical protein
MFNSINKSKFAPKADKAASTQLNFLVLNSPFTVIINNYKSNFVDLNLLRSLVSKCNGLSYHPNKNVKTRSFEGFNTVLSPTFLSGLVVFAFFNRYSDLINFFKKFESLDNFSRLTYFSLLINGHIVNKKILSNSNFITPTSLVAAGAVSVLNKNCFISCTNAFHFSINKIYMVLNAYVKSTY